MSDFSASSMFLLGNPISMSWTTMGRVGTGDCLCFLALRGRRCCAGTGVLASLELPSSNAGLDGWAHSTARYWHTAKAAACGGAGCEVRAAAGTAAAQDGAQLHPGRPPLPGHGPSRPKGGPLSGLPARPSSQHPPHAGSGTHTTPRPLLSSRFSDLTSGWRSGWSRCLTSQHPSQRTVSSLPAGPEAAASSWDPLPQGPLPDKVSTHPLFSSLVLYPGFLTNRATEVFNKSSLHERLGHNSCRRADPAPVPLWRPTPAGPELLGAPDKGPAGQWPSAQERHWTVGQASQAPRVGKELLHNSTSWNKTP